MASWKEIYGHKSAGKQTLVKSEFYDIYGSGFNSLCIGSERDPQKHLQMKTSLSAAFSTKALQEQEHIVSKVVDAFIARIGEQCGGEGMNVTKWYEMVAFDILGEMAFGNSFHCLQDGWCLFGELFIDVVMAYSCDREATLLVRADRRPSILHYRCRQHPTSSFGASGR